MIVNVTVQMFSSRFPEINRSIVDERGEDTEEFIELLINSSSSHIMSVVGKVFDVNESDDIISPIAEEWVMIDVAIGVESVLSRSNENLRDRGSEVMKRIVGIVNDRGSASSNPKTSGGFTFSKIDLVEF